MPYNIGDPMPHHSVVAGLDRNGRNKYVIRVVINGRVHYGSYTEGDAGGYYENGGAKMSTDVQVLLELHWI